MGIWLDDVQVADLPSNGSVDVGSVPVGIPDRRGPDGQFAYDVAFDDVAFGTSRLGPVADSAPPSTPSGRDGPGDIGLRH